MKQVQFKVLLEEIRGVGRVQEKILDWMGDIDQNIDTDRKHNHNLALEVERLRDKLDSKLEDVETAIKKNPEKIAAKVVGPTKTIWDKMRVRKFTQSNPEKSAAELNYRKVTTGLAQALLVAFLALGVVYLYAAVQQALPFK